MAYVSADVLRSIGCDGYEIERRSFFRLHKGKFLRSSFNHEFTRMGILLRKDRPKSRIAINTLSEKLDLPEIGFEECFKLIKIQLMNVEGILEIRHIRVQRFVWSGEQKYSGVD